MLKQRSISRVVRLMACVGMMIFLVAGAAPASAHGTGKGIHACINKKTRAVRIVGRHKSCKSGEKKAHWRRKNKPGPAGATGATGATGT